jgi:hypothetical protein
VSSSGSPVRDRYQFSRRHRNPFWCRIIGPLLAKGQYSAIKKRLIHLAMIQKDDCEADQAFYQPGAFPLGLFCSQIH